MAKGIFKITLSLFLGYLLYLPQGAHARELYSQYTHVRAIGMGGAYTGLADDYLAIFWNPAGILQKEKDKTEYDFGDAQAEFSSDYFNFLSNIKSSEFIGSELANVLKDHPDRLNHMSIKNIWYFIRKNWGISCFQNFKNDIEYLSSDQSLYLLAGLDVGFTGTYATFITKDKSLMFGFSPKLFYRFLLDKTYQASDLEKNESIGFSEGVEGIAVGLDVGLLYRILEIKKWLIRVGLAITDFGHTYFPVSFGVASKKTPDKILPGYHMGISIVAPPFVGLKPVFVLDVRNFTHNIHVLNKLYTGVEFQFPYFLTLRGGVYQGRPSAGFGLKYWLLEINAAIYFADVGGTGRDGNFRYIGEIKVSL